MCGIVGYIGTEQAAPIILDGLSKLEYRGYDSAGMAIFDGEKINTKKAVGRLKVLENLTHGGESMKGTSGIGHTRWATHGAPSDINSHPHMNNAGTIAVVHNGIIENYIPLKKKMQDKGYQFISETDTEVLAHLLDYYYKGNPLEAITKVLHRVEGSYALGIMFADQPDKIFAARKDSPLIVGKSESGSFIASDVPAILKYTRTVYYVDNQEVVELKKDGLRFFSVDEEEITKTPVTIDWDANAAEKGGYEHFMLKEIYEQPKTINDTISPRIKDNDIVIEELNMSDEEIQEITKIHIVACGSAYHTGVTAKYVIEGLARIPVELRKGVKSSSPLALSTPSRAIWSSSSASPVRLRIRWQLCGNPRQRASRYWGLSMSSAVPSPEKRTVLCTPGQVPRSPLQRPRLTVHS